MKKAWEKIKLTWEENPVTVVLVASLAATAAAKVLHEVTLARNARTYRLETERRMMR